MKNLAIFAVLCCLLSLGVGCASDSGGDTTVTADDAAAVQALAQGEDGSDADTTDATEDAPTMDRDCSFDGIRKHIIATYDQNADGKLEADELAALGEDTDGATGRALRKHVFRRHLMRLHRVERLHFIYDDNGDGKLDDSERAELKMDLEERCDNRKAALLAKYDANKDGMLDDAEWKVAVQDLVARFAQHRAALLAKYDTNKDGKLDLDERFAARMDLRDQAAQKLQALKDTYDVNHDGKLDSDEATALRTALKARVRGEQLVSK